MPISVSIIIPCLNERTTISLLLEALFAQTYPCDRMEVVIADGGSTDGTQAEISEWQAAHPDLRVIVIDNPRRIIPAALNTAINTSHGEMIVRMDAHAKPHPEYVERVVTALSEARGENVGGAWDIRPSSDHWIARSIAAAAGHPIGVGDARYRYSDKPGYVDTVPFGAFKRELLDQIGMFDETLLTNEDYEFNVRVRQNGGQIWFDPRIRAVYYARKNLKALAQQYWRYGYWKWQMLRRYPHTLRWRQALPPLFVAVLILLIILAPFIKVALWVLAGVSGFYALILLMAGLQLMIKHKAFMLWLGVPLAIACMHITWGSGFLWGAVHPQKNKIKVKM